MLPIRMRYHGYRIFIVSVFFLTVLFVMEIQGQQPEAGRIVSVSLTATDGMRPITSITKEKVILTENNIPREIVSLIKDERPASVAILLDKSGLVSQQK